MFSLWVSVCLFLFWSYYSGDIMILTGLIVLPFIAALILFLLSEKIASYTAVILSIGYFLFSLFLFFLFDPENPSIQLAEQRPWFPSLGIQYFVGIDGISFWLVLLTSFLFPLCVFYSAFSNEKKQKGFLACLFLLTGFVMGSFLALDGILFYIFFEGSLLPLFFLILLWGGKDRIYASLKFFIYTALGSLFMLVGLATLMFFVKEQTGAFSANILDFYQLKIPFIVVIYFTSSTQSLLFFAFFFAFAVKAPLFPFHTWLPLAHVEAPTAGSVFLAAIVLKMGVYGFLRFILPLFPEASLYYSPWICFLAVLGIIYGALMALAQSDFKKLIAYSSVSHIGYSILGFFVFSHYSLSGGYYQMLTHGLSSAGLFFLVGMIASRTHTKNLDHYGGLAQTAPVYSALFFIVSLSAIALPLTGGFISEFLVLFGTFLSDIKWVPFAVTGVVLGAGYMLLLILKVFFGEVKMQNISDLSFKEVIVILPIIILIFVTGLYPNLFFKYSQKSLDRLIDNRGGDALSLGSTSINKQFLSHTNRGSDTLFLDSTAIDKQFLHHTNRGSDTLFLDSTAINNQFLSHINRGGSTLFLDSTSINNQFLSHINRGGNTLFLDATSIDKQFLSHTNRGGSTLFLDSTAINNQFLSHTKGTKK